MSINQWDIPLNGGNLNGSSLSRGATLSRGGGSGNFKRDRWILRVFLKFTLAGMQWWWRAIWLDAPHSRAWHNSLYAMLPDPFSFVLGSGARDYVRGVAEFCFWLSVELDVCEIKPGGFDTSRCPAPRQTLYWYIPNVSYSWNKPPPSTLRIQQATSST